MITGDLHILTQLATTPRRPAPTLRPHFPCISNPLPTNQRQAQFRAETAVDSLDSALTKCITLLDGLMSKSGPVLDKSLSAYKQGLTFIDVRAGYESRV